MADREGFLTRWSRRKREAGARSEAAPVAAVSDEGSEMSGPCAEAAEPLALPPLESLGPDSDYSAFLAPDVPGELHRMALRKAWTSNPTVAAFRGMGEYDWDCNAPGYGQLLATDQVGRLCDAVLGRSAPPEAEAAVSDGPEVSAGPESDARRIEPAEAEASVAMADSAAPVPG